VVKEKQLYRQGGKFMIRNDHEAPIDTAHWTEIKINEAITLLDQYIHEDKPFFLNIWFDVPHTPYEPAPEPHLSKYRKLGVTGDQLYFRSMVSHLDENIGRLVDYLKENDIFDNTIIIFTSDNGPAYQGSPGPFKGGKTDLHEGGIRVPMFAIWEGIIPENSFSFNRIHMADIFPTICNIIGVKTDGLFLDGKSVLNEWLDPNYSASRGELFWQMDLYQNFQNQGEKPTPYATSAISTGKWKLLADSTKPVALYNLKSDHREIKNLIGTQPVIEQKLRSKLIEILGKDRNRTGFIEKTKTNSKNVQINQYTRNRNRWCQWHRKGHF
jgi:arylsulfatase A-like enzyme